MTEPTPEPLLVTIPEAGRMVRAGRAKAFELAKEGVIPTVEFAGRRMVPVEELRRRIAQLRTGQRGEAAT